MGAEHAERRILPTALACTLIAFGTSQAQNRGVYPLGMSATGSGIMPASGFSYSNQFLFYSRNLSLDADGEVVTTGSNSVLMDMNGFVWASSKPVLGGARMAASATLPIANNSLSSDVAGAISGGGGFADSYYQPLILGWATPRAEIKAIYGFLAPTGRFDAGEDDNVGSGYWTHVVASGQTFYLTADKRTAISTFQMYEFHGTQESTGIRPGQNLNLDYSITRLFPLRTDLQLQLGVVGYEQWQTTDKAGPAVTPEQASAHYRVNAFGFTANLGFPAREVGLGFKYFKEFSNRSTFQGHSLQIAASVHF
ncbi:MAG TPA: transporter [Gemmatimonadales bacterium]|nr:transporter [Gemmatimonadales bacterium]